MNASPVTTARQLLSEADRLSRAAHNATRWPYVTFLLWLGGVTSVGTFAMGIASGDAFGIAYVSTIALSLIGVVVFTASISGRAAFARGRRWSGYIGAWTILYVAAVLVATFAHGSAVLSGALSTGILLLSIGCAIWEGRR